MILDQVTDAQMPAGRVLAGAAMVAFLGAPMFRRQAQAIRTVVTCLYLAGVLGFMLYFLL
jgi:hypothetical protein